MLKSYIVMTVEKIKRLPYGTCNFERIRLENYAYVDKTNTT